MDKPWVLGFIERHFTKLVRLSVIFLESRILNKYIIQVIGDSHSNAFSDISYCCVVHHIGPATAHNLSKENSSTSSREKLLCVLRGKRKKDLIVLVFGEIDCRIHIYYQYMKNGCQGTLTELIDKTISNYGRAMTYLGSSGIEPIICSVVPPGPQGNVHNYPYYPSREIRSDITKEFNLKLKLLCEEKGYQFLDIYSGLHDEKGFLIDAYCDDGTHLNSKATKILIERFSKDCGMNVRRFSVNKV